MLRTVPDLNSVSRHNGGSSIPVPSGSMSQLWQHGSRVEAAVSACPLPPLVSEKTGQPEIPPHQIYGIIMTLMMWPSWIILPAHICKLVFSFSTVVTSGTDPMSEPSQLINFLCIWDQGGFKRNENQRSLFHWRMGFDKCQVLADIPGILTSSDCLWVILCVHRHDLQHRVSLVPVAGGIRCQDQLSAATWAQIMKWICSLGNEVL